MKEKEEVEEKARLDVEGSHKAYCVRFPQAQWEQTTI